MSVNWGTLDLHREQCEPSKSAYSVSCQPRRVGACRRLLEVIQQLAPSCDMTDWALEREGHRGHTASKWELGSDTRAPYLSLCWTWDEVNCALWKASVRTDLTLAPVVMPPLRAKADFFLHPFSTVITVPLLPPLTGWLSGIDAGEGRGRCCMWAGYVPFPSVGHCPPYVMIPPALHACRCASCVCTHVPCRDSHLVARTHPRFEK